MLLTLLALVVFVQGSGLPMNSGERQPWITGQANSVSGASLKPGSDSSLVLPPVLRYKEIDNTPWISRLEASLKHKLSLSSVDRELRSSNSAMERMIKKRPSNIRDIDPEVRQLTNAPRKIFDFEAIKLPRGERQGSQALAAMTSKGKSFWAQDNKGRVWLFDTKHSPKLGKHFTYTGNLKGGNHELVRYGLSEDAKRVFDVVDKELSELGMRTMSASTFLHRV